MKTAMLCLIVLFIGALLGAPFIDLLAPKNNIYLIQIIPENGKPAILANGAQTLWFQWQSWVYILLFCLTTSLLGAIISSFFRKKNNQTIKDRISSLDEEIEKQKEITHSYRMTVKKEIEKEYQQKMQWIEKKIQEQHQIEKQLQKEKMINEKIKHKATELNRKTDVENRQIVKESQKKLAQRDRLSEQKKLLVNYLKGSNWKWSNGEKVTYQTLLREAKRQPST